MPIDPKTGLFTTNSIIPGPRDSRVRLPWSNYFTQPNSAYHNSSFFDNTIAAAKPSSNLGPAGEYNGWQDSIDWDTFEQSPENAALVNKAYTEADTNFNANSAVKYDRPTATITGSPENTQLFMNETGQTQRNMFDGMTMGDWMNTAAAGAGAIKDLYGIYQGEKMYDLAKDQFAFDRKLTKTNLFNQAQTVNADMASRQRAANAVGVGSSVSDYMDQYGVKGRM